MCTYLSLDQIKCVSNAHKVRFAGEKHEFHMNGRVEGKAGGFLFNFKSNDTTGMALESAGLKSFISFDTFCPSIKY